MLGLLIFETTAHPVTASIMITRELRSPRFKINCIAGISLLLLFFGKQVEYFLSV